MKALIQRVALAEVRVDSEPIGRIGPGLLVLLGVRADDSEADARLLADKTAALRIFPDAQGKMNLSVESAGGSILAISQFTLYADTRHGNRPGFTDAARPDLAEPLYARYVDFLRERLGAARIQTGRFGADMQVELINDGPVTLELCTDAPPMTPEKS